MYHLHKVTILLLGEGVQMPFTIAQKGSFYTICNIYLANHKEFYEGTGQQQNSLQISNAMKDMVKIIGPS